MTEQTDHLRGMTKDMFFDSLPDDIDSFLKSLQCRKGGKEMELPYD